jgi:hypothetical protein
MKEESIYEKVHDSAEHYNLITWTVFSIGVALSLYVLYVVWPLKTSIGAMQFFMSIFGFLVLFYCILSIESFGQKKNLMHKIFNKGAKKFDLELKIKNLPFYRTEWLAEMILLSIFLMYIYLFWFVWDNNSLETFGIKIIFLAPIIFVISLILLFIVISNWILRPKEGDGNFIEKIRRIIFGNWSKSYGEIIEKFKINKEIDWKKYSKEDRKFLINLSIANREYCSTVAIFIYSTLVSISAFILSLYSIAISITKFNKNMVYVGIFILIILLLTWVITLKIFRKITGKWVTDLNKQYQIIHKTIHPDWMDCFMYYLILFV